MTIERFLNTYHNASTPELHDPGPGILTTSGRAAMPYVPKAPQ
jgi:hypothetical protein